MKSLLAAAVAGILLLVFGAAALAGVEGGDPKGGGQGPSNGDIHEDEHSHNR